MGKHCIGLFDGCDAVDAKLLVEAVLEGAPEAFDSSFGLRRASADPGTLTFRVTGDAGQTSLTIDRGSLEADGLAHEISNVGTKDGVIDIVGAVNASDLNCSGIVTVADALVVLKYTGEGKYAGLPGCRPPGNTINGALWGDVNADGVADARDALQILPRRSQPHLRLAGPALCGV